MEIPVTPESPRKEEKKPPYSEKSINKQNEAKNFVQTFSKCFFVSSCCSNSSNINTNLEKDEKP